MMYSGIDLDVVVWPAIDIRALSLYIQYIKDLYEKEYDSSDSREGRTNTILTSEQRDLLIPPGIRSLPSFKTPYIRPSTITLQHTVWAIPWNP